MVSVFVFVFRLLPELAEHEGAPVLFRSVLPPEVDRRTVSNIFQRLLGKASVFSYHRVITLLVLKLTLEEAL